MLDFIDNKIQESGEVRSPAPIWRCGIPLPMPDGDNELEFYVLEVKARIRTLEGDASDFRAVLNFSDVAEHCRANVGVGISDEAELTFGKAGVSETQKVMFVRVHQVPQNGERGGYRRVPAVVRLNVLNGVPDVTAERCDFVFATPSESEFVFRVTDRELELPAVRRGILSGLVNSNCVNEVIQADTKVMQAIRDNEAPSLKWRTGTHLLRKETVAGAISIDLWDDFVWGSFHPRQDFILDDLQMSFRPVQFCTSAGDVEWHKQRYDWRMKSKPESAEYKTFSDAQKHFKRVNQL